MSNRATWLLLLAAVSLAGCIPDSINPLGDPATAAPDPRLAGRWMGTMNDEPATLVVTAGEGAMLQFRVETTDSQGKKEWVLLDGFPARVKGRDYMSVKFREEAGKVYDPADQNYYICRYALSHDGSALAVWAMDERRIVDVIADGFVNGSVDPNGGNRIIHITDSTTVLKEYVESADPDRVFGHKLAAFRWAPG